jgi:hypothetical protein
MALTDSHRRDQWLRKQDEAHEAVLEMLKRFELEKTTGRVQRESGGRKKIEPLKGRREVTGWMEEEEEAKAAWRLSSLGPKIVSYEKAPWEMEEVEEEPPEVPLPPEVPRARGRPRAMERVEINKLENIIEDEEDTETLILSPLPTPVSPTKPPSPSKDFSSQRSIRSRTGLKKIFLAIRPRRKEEEPLSPTTTISSTSTTPSLPTPTITIRGPRMESPPRFEGGMAREDGRREYNYRLPELRLSRADWSDWSRQVAERL